MRVSVPDLRYLFVPEAENKRGKGAFPPARKKSGRPFFRKGGRNVGEKNRCLPADRPVDDPPAAEHLQSHAQFRQVNKNKQGNYLVPLFATSEIREISPSGQLLKSVKVDGNPFSVAALDNCNYLVACGDAHCFIELNFETGDIVRKVNANDIEGAQLFFVAQLLPKRDGGLYICNWQGHDGEAAKGHYPQLIEINGAGKMVWDLNDNATFGMISSICPID